MRILGIVGSMRKNRFTHTLVNLVVEEIKRWQPDAAVDMIFPVDKIIQPCRVVCSSYCSKNAFQCSIRDDIPAIVGQMIKADALVIGAPLYFRGPPAQFQAFIERLVSIFFFNESQGNRSQSPLAGKPCGLVGVTEYSNPQQILEYLNDFCTVLKMKPVTIDRLPYLGVGGQGDIYTDSIFEPFERSKDLAQAILKQIQPQTHS
jgi:multimeric flavodoxin WrbA